MKLDIRLRMVAGLVRPGKPLVDVGTDHAYLPVFLVSNDIIPNAIASDVKAGPLQNAKKTIAKYELSEKITPLLSDGLKDIPHDYTDFVIAGMGGELIAKILSDSPWAQVEGNHFVLQPQTHQKDLREYLLNNGYEIICEDVVRDGKHVYLAMEATYTGKVVEHKEYEYYLGEVLKSSSMFKNDYIDAELKRLEVQLKATREQNLQTLIDQIKEARQ